MSNVIDQKVVEMRFDNKQFEAEVANTLTSVDKLKKNLNFAETTKETTSAFEKMAAALKNTWLGREMQEVRNKMEWLADFDLAQYLVQPLFKVRDLMQGLTIEPVGMGFNEYELKMGSIQTIMASTGEDLETVNRYLGELNEYSDKTIYSFQDMTSNIGKFTNAGISLKDSVAAIQGVANVAAVSGANANDASRAMYNFSQALSSGYVKLIDWKSIENANMATVEFKNQLLETAVTEGKLTKTSDGMYKTLKGTTISATKMFNDSLQEQWMTSEVLTKTLAKYSDETTEIGKKASQAATEVKTLSQLYDTLKESAQSGWAQTWEIIVGDFEEAKKFLAELNDLIGGMIGRSADSRNELLENWSVLGGREELLESFRAIVDAITSIVKPIKEAWSEVFSPLTSEGLYGFTVGLKEFFQSLVLSDEAADNLRRTFKGLFSLLSIVGEVFKGIGSALGIISDGATDAGGGLLGILAIIGDLITTIADFVKETQIIRNAFIVIGKVVKLALTAVGKLLGGFGDMFETGPLEVFTGLFENLAFMLNEMADTSTEIGETLKTTFKNMGQVLMNSTFFKILVTLWNTLKSIVTVAVKAISSIFKGIGNALASGDVKGAFDIINGLLEGGVLVGFGMIIKKIIDMLKAPSGFLDSIREIFDNVSECVSSFTQSIKAQALKTIATAILILTASLIALTFVDKDKLEDALAAITVAFGELLLIFTLMGKIGSAGVASNIKTTVGSLGSLIGMMIALLAITHVIRKIGELDWETWGKGLLGVTLVLTVVATYQVLLSRLVKDDAKARAGIKTINKIAFALLLISIPLRIIGSMDWASWGRGLIGITVLIAAMTAAAVALDKFSKQEGNARKGATAMVVMALAINMIVPPLLVMGLLPTDVLIQGAIGLVGILAALWGAAIGLAKIGQVGKTMLAGAGAIAIMAASIGLIVPSLVILGMLPTATLIQGALGLVGVTAALWGAAIGLAQIGKVGKTMLAGAGAVAIMAASIGLILPSLIILGAMPIEMLLQGALSLVGIIAALSTAVVLMSKLGGGGSSMILAATSIAIMAASINLLIPALLALSLIPSILLVKSLGAIAIALVIFVAAAKALTPVVGTIVAIGGAVALFGVGVLALGAGLIAAGVGLKAISVGLIAFVAALGVAAGALGLFLVGIVEFAGAIIVAFLEAVANAAPALAKAIVSLVVALCDAIVECVPRIVNTILIVIDELLKSLVEFLPRIISNLIDLIAGVIQALIDALPEILKAIKMDPESIRSMFELTGMLTIIMAAFAAMKYLGKAAMQGVLYMGLVIAELTLVLAAIGALSRIPGLQELIDDGGGFLQSIGTAIGKFVGGIVGGFAVGATSTLPEVGKNLSDFMTNAQAFIDGVKQVDSSVLSGTATLVGVVLALTAASILEGLTSWTRIFTGGSSLASFGDELVAFAPKIKQYADIVAGIDGTAVEASANAARCLAELANNLPNSGGWVGKIFGENDMGMFGEQLIPFGEGLARYSQAVAGINVEALTASVNAAKGLVELADLIPNTGGLISFLTGDNRMDIFGSRLVIFGMGIKGFATSVSGLVDDGSLSTAVTAAKALVELSNNIPNEGGIVSWFAGENSIAAFSGQLANLGRGIKGFATEASGISPDEVVAAANAGKSLAEMTKIIPNEGGVVAWFTGENSITTFADSLPKLGAGIKGFSDTTSGISPDTVSAAAEAAKMLAEMTSYIPNEGGMKSWFSGESSVSKFAGDLTSLGEGISGFASVTSGISSESVKIAAEAAKTLAEMTTHIPSEGGIKAWFSGETSISKFGNELPALGKGLSKFSSSVSNINPDNVTAAANAAKNLAEMTTHIPSEGGIKAWFSGESSVSTFASQLPILGKGLTNFSNSVANIKPDNVTAGANAAKAISEMTQTFPSNSTSIGTFGNNIAAFGTRLKEYFTSTSGINEASITASTKALTSIKGISEIDSGNIKSVADAIKEFTKAVKNMATDIKDNLKKAGKEAIEAFIDGIEGKLSSAKKACEKILNGCVDSISGKSSKFESAGKAVITGFCDGITNNTYKAEAKAAAMAQAAYKAAKEQLVVNSPSKIFRNLGTSVPEGFAMGISKFGSLVEGSTADMTDSAVNGVKDSISKLSTIINSDIDTQPTIRPVLDLSDVRSGVGAISGMFGANSLGVNANIGAISASMSTRKQNGSNDDVVLAIDELGKRIDKMEKPSYSFNGVNLGDDSAVEEAFETIITAARIARRT